MLLPQRLYLTHTKARPRLPLKALRGIVIHWTANESSGANALANRSYFNQGFRAASAHYIVDSGHIVQCLPDHEVAYHCGDRPLGRYKPIGLTLMNGFKSVTPNYFTIGVEMCVNRDGHWPSTYRHTCELVARLFLAHDLPNGSIYRHYDITGKLCPRPFLEQLSWQKFLDDVLLAIFNLKLEGYGTGKVTAKNLNIRPAPSDLSKVLGMLDQGDTVLWTTEKDGWGLIADGAWINLKFVNKWPLS